MCKYNPFFFEMRNNVSEVLSICGDLIIDYSPSAATTIAREGRRGRVNKCGKNWHVVGRRLLEKVDSGGISGPIIHSRRYIEGFWCTSDSLS